MPPGIWPSIPMPAFLLSRRHRLRRSRRVQRLRFPPVRPDSAPPSRRVLFSEEGSGRGRSLHCWDPTIRRRHRGYGACRRAGPPGASRAARLRLRMATMGLVLPGPPGPRSRPGLTGARAGRAGAFRGARQPHRSRNPSRPSRRMAFSRSPARTSIGPRTRSFSFNMKRRISLLHTRSTTGFGFYHRQPRRRRPIPAGMPGVFFARFAAKPDVQRHERDLSSHPTGKATLAWKASRASAERRPKSPAGGAAAGRYLRGSGAHSGQRQPDARSGLAAPTRPASRSCAVAVTSGGTGGGGGTTTPRYSSEAERRRTDNSNRSYFDGRQNSYTSLEVFLNGLHARRQSTTSRPARRRSFDPAALGMQRTNASIER